MSVCGSFHYFCLGILNIQPVWLFYNFAFITRAMQQLGLLGSLHFWTVICYCRVLTAAQIMVSVPVADRS